MIGSDDTTRREKFNAIFFSAVMVLSMVAAAGAFAGGAAAVSDAGNGVTTNVTTTDVSATHNFSIGVDGGDAVAGNSLDEIDVDYSAFSGSQNDELDPVGISDITVTVNGDPVTVDGAPNGEVGTISVDSTDPNATLTGGDTVNVEIVGVENPASAESPGAVSVTLRDGTPATTGLTLDLTTTQPNVDVEPDPGVATVGSSAEYTVTVTDSNDDPIEGADVVIDESSADELATTAGQSTTDLSTTITTDANGEATQELFNTTGAGSSGVGQFDFTATEQLSDGGNQTSASHYSTGSDTVLVDGEVSDDTLPFTKIEDSGNISVTVEGTTDGVVVDSVNLSDFDTLAAQNSFVESANFVEGSGGEDVDQYTLELKSTASQTYTLTAEPVGDLQGDFAAFDGPTRNIGPGQSDTRNVRLERLITPDNINVIDVSPSSPADIDDTVDVTVEVTTDDTSPSSTLADTPVVATVNNSETTNAGGVAGYSDIFIDGDGGDETTDTDSNGQATFSVNVSGTPGDIEQTIATQIDFTATEGDDVSTSQDLEFVPSIGDTGTLSGTVDVVNENITLGTQSNIENKAGIEVHAVQEDRVVGDSVRVVGTADNSSAVVESINSTNISATLDQIGIDDFDDTNASIVTPTFSGVAGEETGNGDVELGTGAQFRVVTYEDGEAVVQDPRSDYLVRNPQNVEVIENETDQSVEIFDNSGSSPAEFELAFLSNASYQVQQKVVVQNDSTEERVSVYQNITVDEGPNNGPFQTSTEDMFDASEDLTYEGTEARFDDGDRTIQTDVTNEQGNFELLNLPTNAGSGLDFVVMAGGSDTGSASTEYGFANFAGYDTVTVDANERAGQLDTDLSVQEFEPVNQFAYSLDVTVDNGDKSVEVPVDEPVSVEVSATQRELGTNNEQPAEGIEISLEALAPNVGDLADTTVTTDADGEASTTFTGDSPTVGETNISASFDAGNDVFTTEGGEQATVDVFQDAQITGDVVDDATPSNNLPNAEVTLTEENATGDFVEIANTTAGPGGSFSFTGEDGVRSGENYTVEATFTDEEGTEGTGFAQIFDIPGGTTNADIVIEDVVAPEGFEIEDGSLQAPAEAAPGDEIEVSANVTNTAGEEATSDVTFFFNGSDVDSQELTLGAGETQEVLFEVTVPDVEEGDFEHGIATDIDESTATLTVTADNGTAESPVDGVTQEQFDAVLPNGTDTTLGELRASVGDWSDDEQVDGVSLTLGELRAIVDYWAANQ